MSPSSSASGGSGMDSNTKLIVTAIGAALTGAAMGIAAMKLTQSQQQQHQQQESNVVNPSGGRQKVSSIIYEQHNMDVSPPGGAARRLSSGDNTTLVFPHMHEEKMRRRIAARASIEEENVMPRQSVTVRVPATSANMGPGYDTIGMAVDLWSEVTVSRSDHFEITAEGDGADQMPTDDTNYMVIGCKAAFETAQKPMPTLKYHVVSRIPFARGLGSSSAAIVAGIIAGLVLAGHRLPCWGSEALLQIAAGIEGHPDNVAPAIYGSIQLGIHNGTRWATERVPAPPGLQLVMFIPDFIGKTSDARNVLQNEITRHDAAFNISRAAYLVLALCTGNLDNLKYGVQDKLHQPQRGQKLYPYLYPMIEAAESAGAHCAYLSGAGPTVMAITSGASGDIFAQQEKERSDLAVARAMIQSAEECGIKGKLVVTHMSNEGAHVTKVDPPFSTGLISYRDNI